MAVPAARPGRRAAAAPTSSGRGRRSTPGSGRGAGALQALRPLPGGRPEPGLERPGGQVVADAGRAGAAGDLLRDDPGAERGHGGEDVRAALRGGDRPGPAVGEARRDPGPGGRASVTGRPGDDLAGDEVKVRVEARAAEAGEVFLAPPVGPAAGRAGAMVHAHQQDGRDVAREDRGLQHLGEAGDRLPVREDAAGQRPGGPGRPVHGHLARSAQRGAVEGVLVERAGRLRHGGQRGGIALPPHAHHVLAVGQAGGVLGGGAAPVAGQHRPPELRECFPAGRGPVGVGDGRIAAGDLLAVLGVGPDGEPIPGGPAIHATNVVLPRPA